MNYILIALLVVWSFLGAFFYVSNVDDISNIWKRQVARIISGPLVWITLIFFGILRYLSLLDILYVGLVRWLRKP